MRVAETDRHLSVRVTDEDWDGLRRIAEECHISVSAVVRQLIAVYLDAERNAVQETAARAA